VLNSAYK
jgi:hypothetical protein